MDAAALINVHRQLNRCRLLCQSKALPGIAHYLYVSGADQALLLEADPALWSRWGQDALICLVSPTPAPQCVLALPLAWGRGLEPAEYAPHLAELLAAGAVPVGIDRWPRPDPVGGTSDLEVSPLAQLLADWQTERAAGLATPSAALAGLRLERCLRIQIGPACWPEPHALGRPWPVAQWLAVLPEQHQELAALGLELVALLQLLPWSEQPGYLRQLVERILVGLDQAGAPTGQASDPRPWLRLLETVLGGLNSRNPALLDLADQLRQAGLARALALPDPADRALVLMRLLQPSCLAPDLPWLAGLAAALEQLVEQLDGADGAGRELLRERLQQVILSGAGNLVLLRHLLPALAPGCCFRLPRLLRADGCTVLLKGLMLLEPDDLAALPPPRREALLGLFERALPKLWWEREHLQRLLRDLRRFPLQGRWLANGGAQLLPALLKLYGQRTAPPRETSEPELELLRLQLQLLLRLAQAPDQRRQLLRLAEEAGKPALLRLLDGDDEQILQLAAAAALPQRCSVLARLAAERQGVPALLPPWRSGWTVEQAFAACLRHWRQQCPASAGAGEDRPEAPITVLITTHAPQWPLLRQALESLALQTLRPQEVLLIDDGSPAPQAAALAEGLEQLQLDLPLRLLRLPHNQGQYACRNLGLEQMAGSVLAIHDDDDISHPLRLEQQWQALQQPACVAVYARHLRLDQASGAPQVDGEGDQFFGDGITTLMLPRDIALELGGFYPVRSRGDVEFRARLERRYGVGAVQRLAAPLYLMRSDSGTVSSRFEYGCSLSLPTWRRLVRQELLP